jgi:glycine betaine/choline ABC-type transport system substrate-binding protein
MRNADYIPVGQIPMIDLGAQYEAAKARREDAENRKLEYLSQFKRVRGPLTDGLKPEIQKRWDSIEALLEEGDMSLDGRKKLQQQYQDYADFASYGVDFTRALDEREAEVLANPERYNLDVLKDLETYRTVTPTAEAFMNMTLPSLSQYAKYTPKKMSPKDMAFSVYENAKNFDALDNFRNKDGSMKRNT